MINVISVSDLKTFFIARINGFAILDRNCYFDLKAILKKEFIKENLK